MPYPQTKPARGEIYWIDWSPARGSEQAGHRPGVVISVDSFNRRMPVVCVAALTTKIKPGIGTGISVLLPAGSPLPEAGQILPFQVMTIDQDRLQKYAGTLTPAQLQDVTKKLRLCWGL